MEHTKLGGYTCLRQKPNFRGNPQRSGREKQGNPQRSGREKQGNPQRSGREKQLSLWEWKSRPRYHLHMALPRAPKDTHPWPLWLKKSVWPSGLPGPYTGPEKPSEGYRPEEGKTRPVEKISPLQQPFSISVSLRHIHVSRDPLKRVQKPKRVIKTPANMLPNKKSSSGQWIPPAPIMTLRRVPKSLELTTKFLDKVVIYF